MQQDIQLIKDYENDIIWFKSHKSDIRTVYKNIFVAIKNKQIIDSDSVLNRLLEKLRNKGIDPSFALIEFISEKDVKLILKK